MIATEPRTALRNASIAPPEAQTWTLDVDHSQVGFRVRHMMVSWVKGQFERFEGTLQLDEANPESSRIDVRIEAASINTHVAKRDEHLRSADFFDVERFPKLSFRSTRVEKRGADGLRVEGELTLRDVTKPIVLEVSDLSPAHKDPWGGTRRGATATAKLSRKDFGLLWNGVIEGGGVLVGDEVILQLEVEAILQQPSAR